MSRGDTPLRTWTSGVGGEGWLVPSLLSGVSGLGLPRQTRTHRREVGTGLRSGLQSELRVSVLGNTVRGPLGEERA